MRKMIGLCVAGMLMSAVMAEAQDASRMAMAEELLTAMKVPESIEKSFAMVKQMLPAQMQQAGQATGQSGDVSARASSQAGAMMDMVAEELSWDKMKADYIALYAETFTEDEMRGIIAFFKSPAGLALTAKQPALIERSMQLSQKMMARIMPRIQGMAAEQQRTPPAPAAPTVQK